MEKGSGKQKKVKGPRQTGPGMAGHGQKEVNVLLKRGGDDKQARVKHKGGDAGGVSIKKSQ